MTEKIKKEKQFTSYNKFNFPLELTLHICVINVSFNQKFVKI